MMMFSLILASVCLTSVFTLQESCYHKGEEYEHGERFMDECNRCYCSNGAAACTRMGCDVHHLSRGKSCYHKGEEYEDGERFMDECNRCYCSNGAAACTRIGCNVHPLSRRTSEQQLPDVCLFNGNVYNVGDSFMDADDCNTCGCAALENGETATFCTLMACNNLNDITTS